ncbi:MAG: hypothetical protein KF773_29015 [Deltaproteobacteria bacterium]|nr:hypothetical protein [Deltaproteobacteria bacterium]
MRATHTLPLLLAFACSGKSSSPPPGSGDPGSGGGSGSSAAGSGSAPAAGGLALEGLAEGKEVRGWKPVALYLDDADAPLGARFVHGKTGFTLDYLRIESAPQGMLWVTSFPTSDQGEPHTQEHLLLGKGDRGRKLGSVEAMSLAHSSAFTAQWRTAYHFNTVAGNEVFWPVFENQLDAMLHPDYTDEEIRREVRNFGYDKGTDGKLHLEEKGTVYNEMVRTYEQPEVELWRAASQLVYGAKHPLALDSGGFPEAIRTMTPEDIRRFHASTHHLVNMGMVGAFPRAMTLEKVLDQTAATLERMKDTGGTAFGEANLPAPAPAAPGTTKVVEYPYADTSNPGPVMLMWPATRKLADADRVLLELFLDAFAGDESTPMYKKLIDGKTRAIDLGANGLGAGVSTDQGQPIYLQLNGVKADKLDEATIGEVKKLVAAELARIAGLPAGDPELAALHERMANRATDTRRRMTKFLDSPPRFGIRGTGSNWMDHLTQLARTPGWKKSLTMRPSLASVDGVLADTKANPWASRLKAWGLLDAPFAVAAKPSTAKRKLLDGERGARIEAELARLVKQYGAKTTDEALQKYQVDYDAETKKIEDASRAATLPELVANPPMTNDDALAYTTDPIAKAPALSATIDTMTSSRAALAFRLDGVDPAHHMYLAMMPTLLTDVGIVEGDKTVSSEQVKERQRKEILALSASYAVEPAYRRAELLVEGAGNSAAETKLALAWMGRVLQAPAWRLDNLARLRDVVDHQLTAIKQTTLGAEEAWALEPRDAWLAQSWPVHAHVDSFLAQTYDIFRLRWQLSDPQDPKVTAEFTAWLGELDKVKALPREKLAALAKGLAQLSGDDAAVKAAAKLSPGAQALAKQAGVDLGALLSDLPDGSLADDWSRLVKRIGAELAVGAPKALAALEDVRRQIVAGPLRIYQVGSTKSLAAIRPDLEKLAGGFPRDGKAGAEPAKKSYIAERLAARGQKAPLDHLGLVVPSASSGVFANVAPGPRIGPDLDEAALVDYLASNLYTGHGAHSLFMKTWGAGLAYSNGVHTFLRSGWIEWYAERCPLLPQTLRFVAGELDKAKTDPNLGRYALTFAFASRVADAYEARTRAMAADIADGITPDVVRGFRTKLLALAKQPDLADKLFARMPAVYGRVVPGYGPKAAPVAGQHSFAIGPEKQLGAFEQYLRQVSGKDAAVARLYGRDYWVEP